MDTNYMLNNTGIRVVENRLLDSGTGYIDEENNTVYLPNIYPVIFMGCGSICSLESVLTTALNMPCF